MPTVRTPASTFFTEDKGKVRLITTANIASLNDELTHDSIALKDGDLVCCANQTDTAENGIWVVKDGANWVRASNARYAENLINGCRVTATEGTHAGRDAVLSVPYPTTALREEYDDTGGAALVFTIDASSGEEVRGPSPSSSTNNAIARWDTNTGRLIQDSEVIVADGDGTGNLTLSPATALGSAFITLPEDTDNGTEALTIRPAAALASSETLTLDFDGSVTIAGGSNATVDLDALDSNNIAAGGVNEDRLAAGELDARTARAATVNTEAGVADMSAAVTGRATPVVAYEFDFADGAGTFSFDNIPHALKIVQVYIKKTGGAGGAGDTIQVQTDVGAGQVALFTAVTLNIADGVPTAPTAGWDDAQATLAVGDDIDFVIVDGNAGATDLSCEVTLICLKQ